ncbi:class I SAM-dependent methyltransferase [Paenibacillus kandeliae]|uniref:class I SAM-dependent methyltransferase n=1 Tax=Paenibacillus kandeliae TaxID=3231269 RepID=UPI00345939DF
MQQKRDSFEQMHDSIEGTNIQPSPNNSSASIVATQLTDGTDMSWQGKAAGQYHQTIASKIPAYSVLYELSGRLLEAGMDTRESWTHPPSIDQGIPIHTTSQQQARKIAVIGAGGGQEMVTWASRYENWQCIGVDTSARMLETARQRIEQAGVAHRCQLYQGSLNDLPYDNPSMETIIPAYTENPKPSVGTFCPSFNPNWNQSSSDASLYDAASCILVLHFLPSEQEQQEMLNKLAASVKPGAPVVIACLSNMPKEGENNWRMQAWHEHMQDHHIPEEDWHRFVDSIGVTSYPPNVQQIERMLSYAGLVEVDSYFQTLFIRAWCGRRAWEGEQPT